MKIITPKNFDFALIVRGLAALNVIVWHIWGTYTTTEELYHPFIISGRVSVWIFFALSGYLIAFGFYSGKYQLKLNSILKFFSNRFLRIYPIFLVVSLVSLAFGVVDIDLLNYNFFIRNLLMLQWNHEYILNGVFWTLGVEMQFYLFAPVVYFFQEKCLGRLRFLHIPIVIGIYFAASTLGFISHFDLRSFMGNYLIFAFGFLVAGYKNKFGVSKVEMKVAFLAIVSTTLIFFINKAYFQGSFWSLKYMVLSGIFAASLLMIHKLLENKKIAANKVSRLLMKLGVLSYGLYAWHGFFNKIEFALNNLFLAILAPLALSYLSYLVIEKPLNKFKK